ncbi:RidA family protein [Azospirillum brasilense]|uniref:RidA family protein n=1 Tax=Azospirillum brasilense TaxID=192 RepID=UPI000E6856C9|nr:RidA family protein [Azospirillum brasilense]NUB28135.1 RidA family protein [Azospirillum brasilense]NUB33242.1 RidA family protein [Azospirillum brasilense]RIW00150.1 RidA family protein [Azospirillum brasilense]
MNDNASPPPQGHYVPAKRHGDMVFVSGMTPRKNGKLLHAGQVVWDTPVETYRHAVELATENALQAAAAQLAIGERIVSVLNLTVYVNAPTGYTCHSQIADFASHCIESHAVEGGVPSRTAIGVSSLPGGAVVEVALIAVAGPAQR